MVEEDEEDEKEPNDKEGLAVALEMAKRSKSQRLFLKQFKLLPKNKRNSHSVRCLGNQVKVGAGRVSLSLSYLPCLRVSTHLSTHV